MEIHFVTRVLKSHAVEGSERNETTAHKKQPLNKLSLKIDVLQDKKMGEKSSGSSIHVICREKSLHTLHLCTNFLRGYTVPAKNQYWSLFLNRIKTKQSVVRGNYFLQLFDYIAILPRPSEASD